MRDAGEGTPAPALNPPRFPVVPAAGRAAVAAFQYVDRRLASARQRRAFSQILTGREPQDGKRWSVLYFGSGNQRDYIIGRCFDGQPDSEPADELRPWKAESVVRRRSHEVDLVVLDLPWPYPRWVDRANYLESPAWLQQRLRLRSTWQEVIGSFRRNTRRGQLRKIRRHGLEYRLRNDPDSATAFYDKFYRPYLTRRFGDAAEFMPRSYVSSCISNGALLEVVSAHEVLGGLVLYPWGHTLQLVFAGLGGDIREDRSKYVFAALYYYAIKVAFERGFRDVDLTGSRPLLDDGVLRFKRQWGAVLHDNWDWGLDSLLLRPNHLEGAAGEFLRRHPWIVRSESGLVGKVLLREDPVTGQHLQSLAHRFGCEGLKEIRFYALGGIEKGAEEHVAQSSVPVRMFDLRGNTSPVELYCRS